MMPVIDWNTIQFESRLCDIPGRPTDPGRFCSSRFANDECSTCPGYAAKNTSLKESDAFS